MCKGQAKGQACKAGKARQGMAGRQALQAYCHTHTHYHYTLLHCQAIAIAMPGVGRGGGRGEGEGCGWRRSSPEIIMFHVL